MKQRTVVPSYMPSFHCIAGKCEETCCAGWYIAIDEATYKKYKKVKHPEMKKRFEKELVTKKGSSTVCAAKIKLKNNRCAFLGKDNLCDIYRNLGERYLSETCRMYPRNTNQLGETVELSLTLSCPEAARVILLNKEPITFTESEMDLPIVGANLKINPHHPKYFEDYIIKIRDFLIRIWQQKDVTLKERWLVFEYSMRQLHLFKMNQDSKRLMKLLTREFKQLKDEAKQITQPTCYEKWEKVEMAQQLVECLMTMYTNKKWASLTYTHYYEKMITALGSEMTREVYHRGKDRVEQNVYTQYAYIIENYFVNYIYERLVPINQKTPLESLEEMCLYATLIQLHLIGLVMREEKISAVEVVNMLQGFTRVFDHNPLYIQQIKKNLMER